MVLVYRRRANLDSLSSLVLSVEPEQVSISSSVKWGKVLFPWSVLGFIFLFLFPPPSATVHTSLYYTPHYGLTGPLLFGRRRAKPLTYIYSSIFTPKPDKVNVVLFL